MPATTEAQGEWHEALDVHGGYFVETPAYFARVFKGHGDRAIAYLHYTYQDSEEQVREMVLNVTAPFMLLESLEQGKDWCEHMIARRPRIVWPDEEELA